MRPLSSLHILSSWTGIAMPSILAGISRSSRILSTVVAALGISIIMAAVTVVATGHRAALERVKQDNSRLSTLLAEYTGSMMQAINLTLQDIDHDAGLSALTTPEQFRAVMATQEMNRSLGARQSGLQQVLSLSAIGADGRFANVSRLWPTPDIMLSDRPYFQAMQARALPA